MSNSQYQTIISAKINAFLSRLESSRQLYSDHLRNDALYHRGEFGRNREDACAVLIRNTICLDFQVSRGFVINPAEGRTTECDLIIHNSAHQPLRDDIAATNFFPAETVVAIGEVKSRLTKQKLFEALVKLSKNKAIRDCLNGTVAADARSHKQVTIDSLAHHTIAPFTFLICENIDGFSPELGNSIQEYYSKNAIPHYLRHNLILSIEDGLLTYDGAELSKIIGEPVGYYPFPKIGNMENPPVPRVIVENPLVHVRGFLISLANSLENAHCFYPEPSKYL